MSGTCSFQTTQRVMQARQVVQAHSSFAVITSPRSGGRPSPFPPALARPVSIMWRLSFWMICCGSSG